MTFTVLPGTVSFKAIFAEVVLARPYDGPPYPRSASGLTEGDQFARYIEAMEIWEFGIRRFILDVLEAERAHVTLAVDDPSLPPKAIDARALRHVPASRLALSIFETLDYRLKALTAYQGASIFISEAAAEAIRAALKPPPPTGGRPEHPAKAWYAAKGFRRGNLSMKELQRLMKGATGIEPPSESAIRAWERVAKENPQ